jgi:hypothetical protein
MELCAVEGNMITILLALGGLSKAKVVDKEAEYQNIYNGG